MGQRSIISGWGFNVPEKELGNAYFASYLNTSDEWIESRTGIKTRRWAEPGTGASEVALPACKKALEVAGLAPEDVDIIVCATCTPDRIFPSTACLLQGKLGCTRAYAYDINAVCSGFIYALDNAHKVLESGQKALVIGVDIYSSIIDPNDRSTCVLFGDGAGVVVLEKREADASKGVLWSKLGADGTLADILQVPLGSAHPAGSLDSHFLKMEGKEVFKHAVRRLAEINLEAAEKAKIEPDFLISHQANQRILYSVADQLKIDRSKVPLNVQKYGNTSAASVPILLAETLDTGTIKEGHSVVFSAFGGGVTWGAVAYQF